MQKLKLYILFVTIFSISLLSTSSKADEKDKFLLKKIRTLGDINNTQCDLCGCFFGIEPNNNSNSVGLRYSYFKFESDPKPAAIDPNVDHETNPNGETEIYSKIELFAKYNVNPKFRLLLTIPYKFNDINGEKFRDIGDISLIGQYLVYATTPKLKNESQYRQRIYLGGGVKMPSGAFNTKSSDGDLEPHFQTGTGAFDFLVNGIYFAKYKDFGLNADVTYSMATVNKNQYQFANRLNVSSSLFYQFSVDQTGFLPHAGIYLESAGFDKQDGLQVDDSGGNVLFITGGLDMYFSLFSLNINYQYPVSEKLNGDQTNNKFRVITGLSYFFGM